MKAKKPGEGRKPVTIYAGQALVVGRRGMLLKMVAYTNAVGGFARQDHR